MKDLTTEDLLYIAGKLGFKINGVYCRDDKYKIKNGCYIINLDSNKIMEGTHWTAFYKDGNTINYFDSFGFPPPEDTLKQLKNNCTNGFYNDIEYQSLNTNTCGLFCIYFLLCMVNKYSFYDFLYNVLQPFKTSYNEDLIHKLFIDNHVID